MSSTSYAAAASKNVTHTTTIIKTLADLTYKKIVETVLREGEMRPNRTGINTMSIFGHSARYSLENMAVPLLRSKSIAWRHVVNELLWMCRGQTDAKELAKMGTHIWDANGTREFLDSRNLQYNDVGDLGPIYGFQWRHSGETYIDCKTRIGFGGVDQLQGIIDRIRKDPYDRRLVMSSWIPQDLDKMALPPCHILAQFYVYPETHELSCAMYQRSADVGLGLPFNIASYAILTHMIAYICNLRARELIHHVGDMHIYETHLKALNQQISRIHDKLDDNKSSKNNKVIVIEESPRLRFVDVDNVREIDDFKPQHIHIDDYEVPRVMGPVYMKMAV